ncbi:unnamed protein product [Triticum turgidum subsp. durum]|uniref:DUF4220 domain-containing protein n=1 Tax=Triticum turgidum subsp. durum TaxID=4567 RepID=A0A9R0W605_TRITD|nr:unnamed protein product [Triticum turgidum subsp. durum]
MRRHSVSRILNSLIWLAYLSADSMAIFVLGHLAVHASGSHHLLIFWAPFLLLHMGGQDTITAFSMQDNNLWQRHLLGLVTQASVAGYVISISSWQDSRLLAATVLMFLSGVFKYIGRIFCLYTSSPKLLEDFTVANLDKYVHDMYYIPGIIQKESFEDILRRRVHYMMRSDINSKLMPPTSSSHILLDTPLNDRATIECATIIPDLLNMLKYSADRSNAYIYVGIMLVRSYERVYTKAVLHFAWINCFSITVSQFFEHKKLRIAFLHIMALLLLFPVISALITLELFMVAEKAQLYSHTDVTISYILLLGAIILEVASLLMSLLSYFASSEAPTSFPLAPIALCVANYVHPAGRHRKHWSKMLGQYNMFEYHMERASTGIMAVVSRWIKMTFSVIPNSKYLKEFSRIPVSKDLEEFVLDKLLELGTGEQAGWNFASFRGQLALDRWTAMRTTIDSTDLQTSVLIWHIATEICYLTEENNNDPPKKTRVSRDLSNYIMYLVFTCGVMPTGSSKLVHLLAHKEIREAIGPYADIASRGRAIRMVLEANNREKPQSADTYDMGGSSSQPATQMQLLKNNIKAIRSPVVPRACRVADELNTMPRDGRWGLIGDVWLEMFFYIAPRCGGDFHAHHLSTGGEFVTHVLQLMRLLGPFLPPPDA